MNSLHLDSTPFCTSLSPMHERWDGNVLRLFDPDMPMPGYSGQPPYAHDFRNRDPAVEAIVHEWMDRKYDGVGVVTRRGLGVLYSYQRISRISGLFVVVGVGVSIAGAILARGRTRASVLVLLYATIVLYLLPIATVSWDFR